MVRVCLAGLAHRICDLETLPYGLAEMPSVKRVQDWYIHSFDELRSFPRCDAVSTCAATFRG